MKRGRIQQIMANQLLFLKNSVQNAATGETKAVLFHYIKRFFFQFNWMLDKKVGFFLLSCHTPPLLFKSVFTSPLSLLAFCEEQFLIARLFFICLPLITKRRKHVKWQTWQTLKTWIAYICKRIMVLQNLKVMLPKHGSALANNGTANHKAPALAGITPQQHTTNTSDLLFCLSVGFEE